MIPLPANVYILHKSYYYAIYDNNKLIGVLISTKNKQICTTKSNLNFRAIEHYMRINNPVFGRALHNLLKFSSK